MSDDYQMKPSQFYWSSTTIDDCIHFLRDAKTRLENEGHCQRCGFRSTQRNPSYQCEIYVHYGKKQEKMMSVEGTLEKCLEAYNTCGALCNYNKKKHYSMKLVDLDQGAWH